ncbi:MAG: VOC family protein [Gammaproteobacteria bacterium]|nr:VOC family protein [Gammaproteobacteria bacterium]
MIGYVTLGTNDLNKAAGFYDALLGELGASRYVEMETFIAWGIKPGTPMLSIALPYDKNPATFGNGNMIALTVENTEQVNSLYNKALELGGKDEGEPGPRTDNFYAGYFRDLDGNKLNIFCMTSAG